MVIIISSLPTESANMQNTIFLILTHVRHQRKPEMLIIYAPILRSNSHWDN